jgi:predicted dehydrogenase
MMPKLTIHSKSKDSLDVDKREVAYSPVNMYAAEMDYLSQCIEKRQAPTMSTGEEGLFILKVANAAYESGKTGCKIEVR